MGLSMLETEHKIDRDEAHECVAARNARNESDPYNGSQRYDPTMFGILSVLMNKMEAHGRFGPGTNGS